MLDQRLPSFPRFVLVMQSNGEIVAHSLPLLSIIRTFKIGPRVSNENDLEVRGPSPNDLWRCSLICSHVSEWSLLMTSVEINTLRLT